MPGAPGPLLTLSLLQSKQALRKGFVTLVCPCQAVVTHRGALDPAGGTCVSFDKHLVTEVESAFNVGDSDLYLKVGWCSQVAGGCVSEPLKSPHEGGATRLALGQPRESLKIWDRASALLKGNSGGDPA